MFNSTNNKPTALKVAVTAIFIAGLACAPLAIAQEHEHGSDASASKEVTGEVVDMMCYVDHNAMGEEHAAKCGKTCIKSGGPVGIVSEGKAYLVVGEHKPINDQLAEYCGKNITLKGKLAERGGVAMIENAEIVKK
jgi:membrane-bound ClpP family serine protease